MDARRSVPAAGGVILHALVDSPPPIDPADGFQTIGLSVVTVPVGWQQHAVLDLAVALCGVLALLVPLRRSAMLAAVAGWLAIVLVTWTIVFEPDQLEPAAGAFAALAAAFVAWTGSCLALRGP